MAGSPRSLLQALTSIVGAAGMALLVPVAILLIGLPIAFAIRVVLEAIRWVLAMIG